MKWISVMKSLSKHYSFSITHNENKLYYEKIEEYFERPEFEDISKIDEKDKELCIKNDEIWELQWYPITPIGSYNTFGHNLKRCLEKYLEIEKDKK